MTIHRPSHAYFWITVAFLVTPSLAWAVVGTTTSNPALQVEVSVVCPGNDCNPEPPDPPQKPGCTDPAATNYDPDATSDNGSCRYNVPIVLNFSATPAGRNIRLSWTNPTYNLFSSVVIVKSRTGLPTTPTDGEVVYSGTGQSYLDSDVSLDIRYYYAAFVLATNGAYSAPAVASAIIESKNRGEEERSRSGSTTTSPFAEFPEVRPVDLPPELFTELEGLYFLVSQEGEQTQKFFKNGRIRINGSKNVTISIPYGQVPEVLKTIGATIFYPKDPTKSFSFILRLNSNKTAYEATIGALPNGDYSIIFYIINYKNQTIQKINGNLLVAQSSLVSDSVVAQVANDVIAPVAIGGGAAIGLGELLFGLSRLGSFSDVYFAIIRGLITLAGLAGIRRRHKPWGTVYDAVTKRPIDPAYVTVESGGKEISSAITDIDGRYGFYLPAGEYVIKAGKTHYKFPSDILKGRVNDELYGNLYFGEPFVTTGEEVIDKNIPLDPVDFDWNEFVKGKTEFMKVGSQQELKKISYLNFFYLGGMFLSIAYMLFKPGYSTFLMLLLYGVIYYFDRAFKLKHKTVTVKRNGEPLPFAIVRIFLTDVDQQIKSVVADQFGRFFILVRPGVYYLTVEEKQADGSYLQVYRSSPLDLPAGVLPDDVLL